MLHVYCEVVVYERLSFRGASDVRYSRCPNRAIVNVGLSVRISVTVSVLSNKVHFVVVFTKNVVYIR